MGVTTKYGHFQPGVLQQQQQQQLYSVQQSHKMVVVIVVVICMSRVGRAISAAVQQSYVCRIRDSRLHEHLPLPQSLLISVGRVLSSRLNSWCYFTRCPLKHHASRRPVAIQVGEETPLYVP